MLWASWGSVAKSTIFFSESGKHAEKVSLLIKRCDASGPILSNSLSELIPRTWASSATRPRCIFG
eukprot:6687449-Pyramimonas_sp.AAC.1